MKKNRPWIGLVKSEYDDVHWYTVSLDEKSAIKDTCNCLGVTQYLGIDKNEKAIYRHQNLCFHIEWARDYAVQGKQILSC